MEQPALERGGWGEGGLNRFSQKGRQEFSVKNSNIE